MDKLTKAERTKQFIIEKSATLINKQGMAGTSISDIMQATDMAKGGIYGNFENKEEICMQSFRHLSDRVAQVLDEAIDAGNTATEQLDCLLDRYLDNTVIVEGGCPLLNFGVESDDTHPEMNARVQSAIRDAQQRIARIMQGGIDRKELSPELEAKNFAIKAFAMIEGSILCRKVLRSKEQMQIVFDALRMELQSYLL